MTSAFSVANFVSEEFYPGYRPGFRHAAYHVDPVRPFAAEDQQGFWLQEGHWPRGIVPLGVCCIEDCAWGTQWAAQALPVPTGKGLAARLAGTHVYNSEIPVTSSWERARRAEAAARTFPQRIQNFPQDWERCREQLLTGLRHFEQADLSEMGRAEIAAYFAEAVDFQRWAWEQHFMFMYPLLANYFGLRGLCEELGVETDLVARFLQGYDTKILETDRKLWDLASRARAFDLATVFASHDAEDGSLWQVLSSEPRAADWRKEFAAFLDEYGWRTEGMADPDLAPWIEDPTPALNMIRSFLLEETPHGFATAQQAAVAEREDAIARARATLTSAERASFDAALAMCQHANFAWWNEEHDFYIDLRIHIPLRRAALALGRLVGAERPDDLLYLFRGEFEDVAGGRRPFADFESLIPIRRRHREQWAARRADLPKMLGTIPEDVNDPVLKEIFGLDKRFLDVVRAGDTALDELRGVPASSGVHVGRVRVLRHASEVGALLPGEVLVCEFTSPNWTPAFARIGACVADQGGVLAHTAIVSREYRVPCVTGVGIGTDVLRDGDLVEVDGGAGLVRVLERAARPTVQATTSES